MNSKCNFDYFQGCCFSDLFVEDISDAEYAFMLNYPATASWASYPNTKKYFLQDGSSEATKTSYDKIFQQEPWKNLAVLGNAIPGIVTNLPPKLLVNYWREHFGFSYDNIEVISRSRYLDELNHSDRFHKLLTLFPFDHLKREKHAVNPDTHYHLLNKATLSELGVPHPQYETYYLEQVNLEDIHLPEQFPYLIKTSHGLSGEGTYIINNASDLNYCFEELRKYLDIKLLDTIIVSEYIKNVVQNYCVQFYVNKAGDIKLIGTTKQLVTSEGNYLGGIIDYRQTDMNRFSKMIATIGKYAHQQKYFGVIGFDVLEDKDGQMYVIDVNFRVNGSTPLCLQRHTLLERGKEVAKYFSNYRIIGSLESILLNLKTELDNKELIILSALEKSEAEQIYTEIYGIISGEKITKIQQIEHKLSYLLFLNNL